MHLEEGHVCVMRTVSATYLRELHMNLHRHRGAVVQRFETYLQASRTRATYALARKACWLGAARRTPVLTVMCPQTLSEVAA